MRSPSLLPHAMLFGLFCLLVPARLTQAEPLDDQGALLSEKARTLTIRVTSTRSGVPDGLTFSVGTSEIAPTAQDALKASSVSMTKMLAFLREQNISQNKLQTSELRLSPRYAEPGRYGISSQTQEGELPKVIGYEASQEVSVTLTDTTGLGSLLDGLTALGGTRISSPQFFVSKPEPIRDVARQDGILEAQRRALLYAQAAHVKLGRLLSLSELPSDPSPRPFAAFAARSDGAAPLALGELTFDVSVEMVWEILD